MVEAKLATRYMPERLLERYTPYQRKVIEDYWKIVRWTRKYGSIKPGVIEAQYNYWEAFEAELVIEALKEHIKKHPDKDESYTTGILRNMRRAKNQKVSSETEAIQREYQKESKPKMRTSRFVNSSEHERDFEALEYLESLKNSGELEFMREELLKNPRYAPYLVR